MSNSVVILWSGKQKRKEIRIMILHTNWCTVLLIKDESSTIKIVQGANKKMCVARIKNRKISKNR